MSLNVKPKVKVTRNKNTLRTENIPVLWTKWNAPLVADNVDVVKWLAQAKASMPTSYIPKYNY